MPDIVVAGAGPAGCRAAERLAARGLSVLLLDPRAPWEKPCGGGLTAAALRHTPELDELTPDGCTVTEMEIIAPSGAGVVVPLRSPYLVVSRLRLSRWGLDRAGKALMTLLLLRGAQTPGELRTRSERLQPFASVPEVEEALQRMASMDEPLVMELPRRPGQKETRWTHLVGDVAEPAPVSQRAPLAEPELPAGPLPGALSARVAKLEEIVAKLAEDVETLKSLL